MWPPFKFVDLATSLLMGAYNQAYSHLNSIDKHLQ
uniref:Uncharacterized protein n=1 Tax=Anguilla anguilla TaxID=7936 RepID=A0A0E9TTT9_ANGAN